MAVSNKQKWTTLAVLAVLMAAVVYLLAGGKFVASGSPRAGHQAPEFILNDLHGTSVALSQLKGKPVLINFWASWCEPCRMETPDLVRLSEKYKEQVQFYGINLTAQDNVDDVSRFVSKLGIRYPILLDKEGKASDLYKVQYIPTTFMLDGQGKIVAVRQGALSANNLEAMIRQVVK